MERASIPPRGHNASEINNTSFVQGKNGVGLNEISLIRSNFSSGFYHMQFSIISNRTNHFTIHYGLLMINQTFYSMYL